MGSPFPKSNKKSHERRSLSDVKIRSPIAQGYMDTHSVPIPHNIFFLCLKPRFKKKRPLQLYIMISISTSTRSPLYEEMSNCHYCWYPINCSEARNNVIYKIIFSEC